MLIIAVILAASFSAKAQFFWGIQFGCYIDGNNTIFDTGENVRGGTSFNYSIKPSIGYYITPKFVIGTKLIYTSNESFANDTDDKVTNLDKMALNVLMGNGLESDAMSWKVMPYARYKVLSVINEKINIWAEFNAYFGGKYQRESETHKIIPESGKTTYGFAIHPLISFDLMNKWTLFTNLDFLSIGWDGSTLHGTVTLEDGTKVNGTLNEGSFVFQCNPVVAIARSFLNIGVIKKF